MSNKIKEKNSYINHNNEIEEKYKVYYRYVDKDGNEIPETHVLPKKYKLYD